MRTFNRIVRNALTVSLLGIFWMSTSQALASSGAASKSIRHGPPCVTIYDEISCEDGTGEGCAAIDGTHYCTP